MISSFDTNGELRALHIDRFWYLACESSNETGTICATGLPFASTLLVQLEAPQKEAGCLGASCTCP